MPLSHDLRAGVRRLRQNPGFSFVAILTLALGIGANASIFSVINAILFRPLPLDHGSELVSLNETLAGDTVPMFSYPNYRDFRDRNSVLTALTAYTIIPASIGQKGNSQRMWGYLVTGNYFEMLHVKPLLGRLLQPEDDQVRGGHPVMVLTYAVWQKRFGADPNIVNAKVQVNGREFTVLGVAPKGFFGTELMIAPEVFFPMAMQKELEGGAGILDRRAGWNFFAAGRLKPGVTSAQAESALNGIARQLAEEYPQEDGGMKIKLSPSGLGGILPAGSHDRVRGYAVRGLLSGFVGRMRKSGQHVACPRRGQAQGNGHSDCSRRFKKRADPATADRESYSGSRGRRGRDAVGCLDYGRAGGLASPN